MKIDNIARIVSAYQPIPKGNEQKNRADSKKNAYDHLELSAQAKEQMSKERAAKIEALKNQVANGTYQVDSQKVAEKILSSFENGGKVVE
ncbi:flagellar biosynthesis anti-sigma factor FlgM [Ectobacillus sp. sgz5001026]|uniref:flagellar biosynthesis anti-sigma factor FlgM n=1 Tax=Ectobacillus sp. sgz5001026 TaxID=3242473 RepID=UPI0036D40577